MSDLEALLLGVVQGLTEFLPTSCSGHLILVPWLQDYTFLTEDESFNKTFFGALVDWADRRPQQRPAAFWVTWSHPPHGAGETPEIRSA